MTLFATSLRQLGFIAFASAIYLPVVAAELEGTPVPIDSVVPIETPVPVVVPAPMDQPPPMDQPAPPAADTAPPAPVPDELPLWQREHEQQVREMEQQAREHERHVREQENWQRELDKGLQEAFGDHNFDAEDFSVALLIPILAITFIFGGPIFLLCFLMVMHYRAKARRQKDINMNIDKLLSNGRDIPVELLRGDEPKAAVDSTDLGSGVRHLFLGIGLLIFLTALVGFEIGAVGFILIALGCSRIVIWYLNKPATNTATSQQAGQQD